MYQNPLSWNARANSKKSNATARALFDFVSFIYDHPVYSWPESASDRLLHYSLHLHTFGAQLPSELLWIFTRNKFLSRRRR